MKIGILTFHCAHNYGAVLQAFCLQEKLKKLGHDVYVINYRPSYIVDTIYRFSFKCWISKSIKGFFYKWSNEPFLIFDRKSRYDSFMHFINDNLRLYPYNADSDYSEFDALILGSDQIWNRDITGGSYDDTFFGKKAKCKVISYAASNKSFELEQNEVEYFRDALSHLSAISVRELSLAKLLQPLVLDNYIFTVVDPTLLAGKEVLSRFVSCSNKPHKNPYVFIYELSSHDETLNVANSVAKQLNADIIELEGCLSAKRLKQKDMATSPEKFVEYIANAACIVTTSFHGTALSIIFNKPFYAIKQNNSSDNRISSLVNKLRLEKRFLNKGILPTFELIDYKDINLALEKEVVLSENFLKESLSK